MLSDHAEVPGVYVSIQWNGAPCACRCGHCFLRAGEWKPTRVPYQRARSIANRFAAWAQDAASSGVFAVELGVGASYDLPSDILCDFLRFHRERPTPLDMPILVNGLRFRTRAELTDFLLPLQRDGLKTVFLTFHGFRQSHDEFAGRQGDFDYLLMMAEVAAELGLRGDRAILIRKPTLHQLPRLLAALSAINGPAENYPDIYDYLGRAIVREDERPEGDDLQLVPAELREAINMARFRTEGEWVAAVVSGDVPPKSKMLYCLNVDEASVDSLESEPCEDILERLLQLD